MSRLISNNSVDLTVSLYYKLTDDNGSVCALYRDDEAPGPCHIELRGVPRETPNMLLKVAALLTMRKTMQTDCFKLSKSFNARKTDIVDLLEPKGRRY
jgi:hypothetical protein